MFMPVINLNEHIYSLGARYHVLSANQSHRQTSYDLIGNYRGIPNIKFGTSIQHLSRKFNIEIDYLIDNHTYLPIYRLFTHSSNYQDAKNALIAGDIQSLVRYLGLVSGEIFQTNTLGYCRSCIEDNDYLFLQNDHQIPGINICYKHGELLQKKTLGLKVREYFNLNELLTSPDRELCCESDIHKKDYEIAAVAHNLLSLSKSTSEFCYELLREKILSKLMILGYVSSTGKVKQQRLHTDFVEHYSEQYLEHVGSTLHNHEDTWLSKFLIRRSKRIHPIRGIILILFLFDDLSEFCKFDHFDKNPFDNYTRLCLNKVCPQGGAATLLPNSVQRNRNSGGLIASYHCDCGMTFKLSAVLDRDKWKMSKPRIVEWGVIWKEQLAELIHTDLSLNSISARLGTSKIVVKNQLIKMGLEEELIIRDVKYIKKEPKSKLSICELEMRKHQYINIINDTIKLAQNEKKEVTRNLIIQNNGTEYRWLQKNYIRELEKIIPSAVEPKCRNNMRYIDWEKREIELIQKLRDAECELKNRKLSISLIARYLNYYTLHQTLQYMPRLECEIRNLLETTYER